jgi:hypothetical protein
VTAERLEAEQERGLEALGRTHRSRTGEEDADPLHGNSWRFPARVQVILPEVRRTPAPPRVKGSGYMRPIGASLTSVQALGAMVVHPPTHANGARLPNLVKTLS